MAQVRTWIDHIVLAVPDLDAAVRRIATDWGLEPTPGGSHDGRGTRNALLGLGPQTYLEVIGPDPLQGEPSGPRPFAVDDRVGEGALAGWAVGTDNIDALAGELRSAGLGIGSVFAMARTRPDGVRLDWRLTVHNEPAAPFLIDWGDTHSPAGTSRSGATLDSLRPNFARAEDMALWTRVLNLVPDAAVAPESGLEMTLCTPNGEIHLHS